VIAARGLTRRYGEQTVLDGLDLDLPDGAVTAVMGPNGSGKTTLGRLLLGLERPDAGTITGLGGLRRAAVFQEDRLCEQLTAVDNVRLVLDRRIRREVVVDELHRVGLDPGSLAKPVRELSGGQRRRVAIVRALLPAAGLVVLDEPFTGLDTEARGTVLAYVQERCAGRTTLLITHDRAEADRFGARVLELAGPAGG
jgi:NitT/TauT family transport system ATP-binding protein